MSLIKRFPNYFFLEGFKFLLLLFGLIHYALPVWLDLIVAFFLLFFIKTTKQAVFTSLFFVVCALLFSLTWGGKWSEKIWYREHEKWSVNDSYQRNISDVISMPYGDLYAIGAKSFIGKIDQIKEPRLIAFKTDEFGFRNNGKLAEADLVLAGDSFIVANGTDQNDMPSIWLEKLTGYKVANVAYPDNLDGYERRLLEVLDKLKPSASIIVFYFEGNDFIGKDSKEVRSPKVTTLQFLSQTYFRLESRKDRYLSKIFSGDQVFFRIIRRKSHELNASLITALRDLTGKVDLISQQKNIDVLTLPIGDREMGFATTYNRATEEHGRQAYIFRDEKLLSRIKAVFFIPTKWRTYQRQNGAIPTTDAFNYLKNGYGVLKIPVFDLSSALENEAITLLDRGEYVFWRDDTHWNSAGIAAAMAEVARRIK
jgi:hypothetical protein